MKTTRQTIDEKRGLQTRKRRAKYLELKRSKQYKPVVQKRAKVKVQPHIMPVGSVTTKRRGWLQRLIAWVRAKLT